MKTTINDVPMRHKISEKCFFLSDLGNTRDGVYDDLTQTPTGVNPRTVYSYETFLLKTTFVVEV